MKKLAILLIAVLVGILFINTLPSPSTAEELTLYYVIELLNDNISKLTESEMDILERRLPPEDFDNAIILMNQWTALLRVSTEAGNIIAER